LKTSRDISALGFPTCCKTWQEWVTERRGAYSARVKLARLTKERGSSFWPSVVASEVRQGFQDRSRGKKGSQESLTTAVVKDAANWPTPRTNDDAAGRPNDGIARVGPNGQRYGINLSDKVLHGQAAPASTNTSGSRQGLWPTASVPNGGQTTSGRADKDTKKQVRLEHAVRQELWLTPRANEPDSDPNFAARNADRGAHCHGTLSSQAKGEQWRTPTSFDWKNTDCSTQVYLSDQVEGRTSKQTDFPTPRTCDWKSSPNADSNIKRMEVGQATLAEFVHAKHKKGDLWSTPRTGATESSQPNNKGGIPLADQAKREQWATPQAHDAQGPKTPEQIAAMRAKGHGVKNLKEQACWGTPTARDHKSGRGNNEREYKELTPMVERRQSGKLNPRWVETLMGLPIGWTMPSCTSPQTIELMSCDSSAMELCPPPQSEPSEFSLASWPSPRAGESQQTEELSRLWVENGFKQPKTRGGKARANGSTFDVTLETAARGVAAMEAKP